VMHELELRRDDVVYDLGCGDGRVLRALARNQPGAHYIGVENDWAVWALAKVRTRGAQVLRREIAATPLTSATRVFAYLGAQMMAELEPRFERELPAGARVVSVQFPLPTRKPDNIVELEDSLNHASRLYVYTY
jgi:trans-aconitate methyltransferase